MMSNHRFGEGRPLDDEGTGIGRPSKQPKLCEGASSNAAAASNATVAVEKSPFALPPEVWAKVMNYLDDFSVLSCAAMRSATLAGSAPLLRELLTVEDNPPIQQLVDLGAVPELVKLLGHGQLATHSATAYALGSIAEKGTNAHTQAVVDAGAIPLLIRLLSSRKREVVSRSTYTLKEIANTATFRDTVLQAGAMKPLLALTSKWKDPSMVQANLSALVALCRGLDCSEVTPCLDPISQLLFDEDEEVFCYACCALGILSDESNKREKAIIQLGVFPRLLQFISHPTPDVQIPAMCLVCRFVQRDKSLTYLIISNAFASLLSCMTSPIENVQGAAMYLCYFVLMGNSDGSNELNHLDANGIQLVEDTMNEVENMEPREYERVKARVHALRGLLARTPRDQ